MLSKEKRSLQSSIDPTYLTNIHSVGCKNDFDSESPQNWWSRFATEESTDTFCSRLETAMDHLDWEQAPPIRRAHDLRTQDLGQALEVGQVPGVVEYGQTRQSVVV